MSQYQHQEREVVSRNTEGRAACVGLIDMADGIFEDKENANLFQLIHVSRYKHVPPGYTLVALATLKRTDERYGGRGFVWDSKLNSTPNKDRNGSGITDVG
ncbi:hypothetical protein BDV93DRAFT_514439 [Ceratobasidium sp. AG-I]|nr:hypothetical protein BDV93DRAFT_514439 [Ceratobasidium sp. AG-I]